MGSDCSGTFASHPGIPGTFGSYPGIPETFASHPGIPGTLLEVDMVLIREITPLYYIHLGLILCMVS